MKKVQIGKHALEVARVENTNDYVVTYKGTSLFVYDIEVPPTSFQKGAYENDVAKVAAIRALVQLGVKTSDVANELRKLVNKFNSKTESGRAIKVALQRAARMVVVPKYRP